MIQVCNISRRRENKRFAEHLCDNSPILIPTHESLALSQLCRGRPKEGQRKTDIFEPNTPTKKASAGKLTLPITWFYLVPFYLSQDEEAFMDPRSILFWRL